MKNKGFGLAIAFVLALCAMFLGTFFPIIGSSVFALILGIVLNELVDLPENSRPGLNWSGKKLLQYSIIFMGFSLPIATVASTGLSSLKISLPTITVAFLAAMIFGKVFHLKSHLRTLIGFGTAICGGSAIAAAAPIIEADEEEIALSMSTIFFFNILAVFIFPVLGHLWHMSNFQFGLWSGTAINDTSSVVAAAFSYSKAAGEMATIVKLTRALMIVPVYSLVHHLVYCGFNSFIYRLGTQSGSSLPKGPFSPLYGHGFGRHRKQGFLETVPCSRSSPPSSRVDCLVLCSRI